MAKIKVTEKFYTCGEYLIYKGNEEHHGGSNYLHTTVYIDGNSCASDYERESEEDFLELSEEPDFVEISEKEFDSLLDKRTKESGLSEPFPRWTEQFYVDRSGKIVRYPYHKAGTHSITFLHSAIAHFIIDNPEEHYPDDRIMEMGWIKVGGVPHIQYTKPPTQSQQNFIYSLIGKLIQ